MNTGLAALLLFGLAAGSPPVHDAQLVALRHVAADHRKVCVAVNPGALPSPATKASHLESTKMREDPPVAVLDMLRRSSPAFVPASQCTRTEREWDIVDRTSREPALLAVVGKVEPVAPNHVRVVVLTSSGFLSDTHTLCDVEKVNGVWTVTSSKIILQA